MVWRATDPEGCEAKKCVWEVAPYLRGTGLDVGAGVFKILPHAISIDNCNHEMFGHNIKPDVRVETAERLPMFASQGMDFVFSSHLLEHIEDYKATLKEWWRVLKLGGHLALYLPHKSFYPNKGEPGANPTHVHDFMPQDIIDAMLEVGGWDLKECQDRNEDMEYSMLLVFKKKLGKQHTYSYKDPKPEKTVLVCRFGAYGDLLQASSVLAGLKKQGYHVTLQASLPAADIVSQDPNIDEFMLLDRDQIPNADLGSFWKWQAKKYTKFVNLSESVEGTWLALPGRTQHEWAPLVRHRAMNFNYLEFQHLLADVPHEPKVRFYATPDEKSWARKQREKMGSYVILWTLAGSSVHKTWAGLDNVLAAVMLNHPGVEVVLCGGPESVILEAGWENEKRVHCTSGKWSIRQTLAFVDQADLLVGPETGVLNSAANLEVPKLVLLSHSSEENLTRDWVHTTSVYGRGTRCKGRDRDEVTACHILHYGWEHCTKTEDGVAQCQKDISAEEVYYHVDYFISRHAELKAA